MNKKLNEKYLNQMKQLVDIFDTEVAHSTADEILCELLLEMGYKDLVDEYNKIDKWYA